MIFGAGLLLLFAGLALLVPGRIPLGKRREISALCARIAGALWSLFLPIAVLMHVLWERNDWGRDAPLINAQLIALGATLVISFALLVWSAIRNTKTFVKKEPKFEEMFEEVDDEESPPPKAPAKPPEKPPVKKPPATPVKTPPRKSPPKANDASGSPFDFS